MNKIDLTKQILVIDDEADIGKFIYDVLTRNSNKKVTVVASPGDAYMKFSNNHYDLIITDFRMPKTDGIELIKAVRAQKHNEKTPVLIISGYIQDVMANMQGIKDVVTLAKPFAADELIRLSDELLNLNHPAKVFAHVDFDTEFVDLVKLAARSIVSQLTGATNVRFHDPKPLTNITDLNFEIAGAVSIQTARFKGILFVIFNKKPLLTLTSQINGGLFLSVNKECETVVTQIAQLLYSEACHILSEKDTYDFISTEPKLFRKKEQVHHVLLRLQSLLIVIEGNFGSFSVVISAAPKVTVENLEKS